MVRLRVTSVALCNTRLSVNFRYAPFATEVWRRGNPSLRARCRSRRYVALSLLDRHDIHLARAGDAAQFVRADAQHGLVAAMGDALRQQQPTA
jgi:hypothetical protein